VKHLLLILPFCLLTKLSASETDAFTFRYQLLKDNKDQLEIINKWTNDYIKIAAKEVSEESGCNDKELRKKIKKKFVKFAVSKFEKKILKSKEIHQYNSQKGKLLRSGGVYGKFKNITRLNAGQASSLLLNGHIIGADKFSHFFTEGWNYFKIMYYENEDYKKALNFGLKKELGLWGKKTTGIFSYADMKANWDGMIFFRRLTETYRQTGDGPTHFTCKNNKWSMTTSFDWADYIDASYDEGNNCSVIYKKKLRKRFSDEITKLEEKNKENYTCPIDLNTCDDMKGKYILKYGEEIGLSFINPICYK